MNGILANFFIMVIASSVGGVVAIISGVSSCMLKSRCTHIDSPCLSCDRDVIAEDNPVYNTPITPPVTQLPINRL
jgi:hypothetical protein